MAALAVIDVYMHVRAVVYDVARAMHAVGYVQSAYLSMFQVQVNMSVSTSQHVCLCFVNISLQWCGIANVGIW